MKIVQITGSSTGLGAEYLYGIDEQGRVYIVTTLRCTNGMLHNEKSLITRLFYYASGVRSGLMCLVEGEHPPNLYVDCLF